MFRTVSRVKRVRCYEDAKYWYENIKPLRGTLDVRPLGERRDKQYQICKQGENYTARLYETDVVTFYPDNKIAIRTNGYATALTMSFVSAVLGIDARRTRGACIYNINGANHTIRVQKDRSEGLVFEYVGNDMRVVQSQSHKQWVVSRAGANTVRRRVSQFRDYFKGFLGLRTEVHTGGWREGLPFIRFSTDELGNVLGWTEKSVWTDRKIQVVNTGAFYGLAERRNSNFRVKADAFYELIRNDQPEETRTTNYYKAAVGLIAGVIPYAEPNGTKVHEFELYARNAVEYLDEVLFKTFADEVFVLKDVPDGKVPSTKYDDWVGSLPASEIINIENAENFSDNETTKA